MQRLRRLLPWLVGLALLAYLLLPYRHPEHRAELVQAFQRAPWWTSFAALAGIVGAYAADTLATWWVLAWAKARMRFREVAVIRGVTYLLNTINYTLGQAAMILVLTRHGVRAARATGIMLFVMGINLVVLLAFTSIALAAGAKAEPAVRTIVWVLAALLPVYLGIIVARPRFLASKEVFAPLFDLGLSGHALGFLARLPHITVMILTHWLTMRLFGIPVPLASAALYLPMVFFIAVLPISAQGIGTSQLVAVKLFAPFASQESILAYSLYLVAIWTPTQLVIAWLCLRTEFGRSIKAATATQKS